MFVLKNIPDQAGIEPKILGMLPNALSNELHIQAGSSVWYFETESRSIPAANPGRRFDSCCGQAYFAACSVWKKTKE